MQEYHDLFLGRGWIAQKHGMDIISFQMLSLTICLYYDYLIIIIVCFL